ncbi:MAG: proline dehydrogenase family protein, partial [Pseudomonadota bacterium]
MPTDAAVLESIRARLRNDVLPVEGDSVVSAVKAAALDHTVRAKIVTRAIDLVRSIRQRADPGLMEVFLAEYGLSTDEGVALMCLAEALLRVPDDDTIDALIEDKITPSAWGKHLGQSSSSLVNASTWALMITGKVLNDEDQEGLVGILRGTIRRLGEPVIRTAIEHAMRELGQQFVLGRTIEEAMERAAKNESEGFTHSYDMLGEAARTEADAKRYHLAYGHAITMLANACRSADSRRNPGISIKLSALHPRYEALKRQRVMTELMPRAQSLALLAKSAGMGLNIDAEEADRLDLSLDVIEALLRDPSLRDWDGFGIVVQAYGHRAPHVIDWLYALADTLDRRIMVRLVKGAYWDTEIKNAQVLGLEGFPVFTRKASTDVAYIACAKKLLAMTDRIYPQFATHNAHTVAAILELTSDRQSFEFQRLHGMGEALHDQVLKDEGTQCRIYAPVGAHRDLLAYLVRRLLENGANSSFVNQIVDEDVPPEE